MQTDFWHERWKNGQIGFHQDESNPYLVKHWSCLGLEAGNTVFVPLAGKTKDILWLTQQGFKVIANELSKSAVIAFFEENNVAYTVKKEPHFTVYSAANINFYCGDYFALKAEYLSEVDAVFDRAALIAMPSTMRESYRTHMEQLLPKPHKMLLISMEYPQEQMDGPPFSVMEAEVNALFSNNGEITLLETFDVLAVNPRFVSKGLSMMLEKVYCLDIKKSFFN